MKNFLGDRYFTIKDIELMINEGRQIMSVEQQNKWIALEIGNSRSKSNLPVRIAGVTIKIKNF